MSSRDYIPLKVQLAAMLLTVRVVEGGKLVPFINFETSKLLTAEQIISLFERDHYPIRKSNGGPDAPWNLVFRPIMEHRIKTATIDVPAIAKGKRLSERQEEFRRKMLRKAGQGEPEHAGDVDCILGETKTRRRYRWPSRKMPSRPFPKRQSSRGRP